MLRQIGRWRTHSCLQRSHSCERVLNFALTLMLLAMAGSHPAAAMTLEERREYLAKLQQILPDVPSFREWLQESGELPPDFDALPRINGMPEPLQFLDGKPVRTRREWQSRRAEIRQLFEKYDLGTFPPKPKLDRAVTLDETKFKGYLIRNL